MDYSFLDVLLDSIFIIDSEKKTIYCNDVAANLCDSSVKRITRGKPIHEFIQFSDAELFVMPLGNKGFDDIFPLSEIEYSLPQKNKNGKVQISIHPFKENNKNLWIILVRDVTVEDILHEKHKQQLEQLEQYSKNLERMVEERTLELKNANSLLNAIMNSLGQGFLVFDSKGICLDVYTKACEDVLEANPAGKNIVSVLNCSTQDEEQFKMWMQAVFTEALPFDSLRDLGPKVYSHSKGKYITLDFFALQDDGSRISNLVLVATDKTAEKEANIALERERAYASMIVKFVTNRKLFANFILSLPDTISFLRDQISVKNIDVNEIFRRVHTLEGEAATLSILSIKERAKDLQEVVSKLRDQNLNELGLVRDEYILALQELTEAQLEFISKNQELINILEVDKGANIIEVDKNRVKYFYDLFAKAGIDKKLNQMFLDEFTSISLIDELKCFNNVLKQVAEKQNKKVNNIHFSGNDIKLDFQKYESLFSSFVHIFRNIIDHGLEEPDERLDHGKPEEGSVTISINDLQASFVIEIRDDGRGIDPTVIRSKLKDKVPEKAWDDLSDNEVIQEIFSPGFSSRETAGEFSGRGVGMDAVKTEVLKLKGKIEVFSEKGIGTTIKIEIPFREAYLKTISA